MRSLSALMIIRKELAREQVGEGIRNGIGPAFSQLLVSKRDGFPLDALALNRLPPGSSWGPKKQTHTQEFFLVLSGLAEVIDNGKKETLRSGDMVWAQNKETLAIRNPGPAELVFLAGVQKEPRGLFT